MATLPICSLCKIPEKIRVSLEKEKKIFLVFSIFIVLIFEWFSIYYVSTHDQSKQIIYDVYLMFWYPLLTQLSMFIIFFSLFLWKERLHFCFRKSATTFYMSLYYLFGVFSVLFCVSSSFYYETVTTGSLSIARFLFLVSLWKNTSTN